MRRALVLVAAAAVLVAGCAGERVTINTGDGSTAGINVSAMGRVTGTPDTLSLTLGVAVRRDSVDVATRDAATLAQAIIAALKDNGVADADIQTANYSIWPEYDWRAGRQLLIGYRVTNELRVKIRELDRAGEVIDAATAAGGDDMVVNGLAFSIEDNTEMLAAARTAAWNEAEAKARQLASLSGVTLGSALAITEAITFDVPPIYWERDVAEAVPGTPIEPGQADVTVTLQVTFAIG